MTIYAFVTGIMAILSKAGFYSALAVAPALTRFFVKPGRAMLHILSFGTYVLLIHLLLSLLLLSSPGMLANPDVELPQRTVLFALSSLVIAVWLIISYTTLYENKLVAKATELLATIALAVWYSAGNFSSMGPLLFPLALTDPSQLQPSAILLPMLAFAVGLVLPMATLVGLLGGIIATIRTKPWLRYFYWCLAGFFLFAALNNLIMH